VVERLGDDDAELRAYADGVFARADTEIAKIREELASAPPPKPDAGNAKVLGQGDLSFLDELDSME